VLRPSSELATINRIGFYSTQLLQSESAFNGALASYGTVQLPLLNIPAKQNRMDKKNMGKKK